jgi:hypothetical protein
MDRCYCTHLSQIDRLGREQALEFPGEDNHVPTYIQFHH